MPESDARWQLFVARSGWGQGDGTAKENDDGADSAVAAKEKGGEGRMASYKAYLKEVASNLRLDLCDISSEKERRG